MTLQLITVIKIYKLTKFEFLIYLHLIHSIYQTSEVFMMSVIAKHTAAAETP